MHPEVYEYNLSVTLRDARRDPRWLVILPLVLPPPEEQRMDALDLIASVGTFVAMYPEHQQDSVLHVLSSNPGIAPFLPLLISRFPGVTTTPDPETRSQSSSLSGNMWDDDENERHYPDHADKRVPQLLEEDFGYPSAPGSAHNGNQIANAQFTVGESRRVGVTLGIIRALCLFCALMIFLVSLDEVLSDAGYYNGTGNTLVGVFFALRRCNGW